MNIFRFYNTVLGWVAFGLSALVYWLTLEPTVSFWDCGEFIAAAFKLQVGHPPGAPLYLLMGRVMALLAGHNVQMVAYWINVLSAIASGFTIMFLFWSITHLARKVVVGLDAQEITSAQRVLILGAGLVGALAFAFTDTFWFSAVEAEVYATSSLFTAVVFWLALKWEARAHEPYAFRWLVLVAYLMGLSIGVHLLNLLAIPAIVLVYYYRLYPGGTGVWKALAAGVLMLAAVQYVLIPGVPFVAAYADLVAVNYLGLPFFSGALAWMGVLTGGIVLVLWLSIRRGWLIANRVATVLAVLLIGYSSYTVIVVRALANPPMNENTPDNMFALLSYLNREQYGNRPLAWGPYYDSPVLDYKQGKAVYSKLDGRYQVTDHLTEQVYGWVDQTVFPRMYSAAAGHVSAYKSWGGVPEGEKPGMWSNLRYFVTYQIGQMYLRYFFWNFTGRQNDFQGFGGRSQGNWLTGISWLDQHWALPRDGAPAYMLRNEAHNLYFLLPLILGVLGATYLSNEKPKDFNTTILLFLLTGLAIIVYLNQVPVQARERDYAYVGSFYVFGIYIGLGVLALAHWLSKLWHNPRGAAWLAVAVGMVVPALLLAQNYDDHDRSGRFTARDWARSYLNSCAKDAVLFTFGDNDTFPLWYVQEVEGYRTDVRVVNLSLLGTDWHIRQAQRTAYAPPLPLAMRYDQYVQGRRDILAILDEQPQPMDVRQAAKRLLSEQQTDKVELQSGEFINYLPTHTLVLPVDSAAVQPFRTPGLPLADSIRWQVPGSYLFKNDLALIQILAQFAWKRPIYFAVSVGEENLFGLKDYLRLEGLAYRLVPHQFTDSITHAIGSIDTQILYRNMVEQFADGRIDQADVLFDYQQIRTLRLMELRSTYNRLAKALVEQGQAQRAIRTIDKAMQLMPVHKMPFEAQLAEYADTYYRAGNTAKGDALAQQLWDECAHTMRYYYSLSRAAQSDLSRESGQSLLGMKKLAQVVKKHHRTQLFNRFLLEMEKTLGGNPFKDEL